MFKAQQVAYDWGKRLAYVLRSKGVTQKHVAESIGVSANSVNKWTAGGDVEHSHLRKPAEFLHVNWVWLRYGQEALASAVGYAVGVDHEIGFETEAETRRAINGRRVHTAFCAAAQIGVWRCDFKDGAFYQSSTATTMLGQSLPVNDTERRMNHYEFWSR